MVEADEWSRLREPWERLRWARLHWQEQNGGATTIRAAADSLGMKEGTYAAYERRDDSSKHIPIDHQRAMKFGRKFKVNWVWILSGEETPFQRTDAQVRAVELLAQAPEEEQSHIVDLIKVALRRL